MWYTQYFELCAQYPGSNSSIVCTVPWYLDYHFLLTNELLEPLCRHSVVAHWDHTLAGILHARGPYFGSKVVVAPDSITPDT